MGAFLYQPQIGMSWARNFLARVAQSQKKARGDASLERDELMSYAAFGS